MSITDELRKWGYGFCGDTYDVVTAIADRIDAEHEKATSEFWQSINAVPATDENMAEYGFVRLPKDADGEYIHIGDVMEWPTTGETFKVVGIGDGTLFYVDDDCEYADWTDASTTRHYHEPTVEDVLREIVHKCQPTYSKDGSYTTGLTGEEFAEYASRLRLADNGEEQ